MEAVEGVGLGDVPLGLAGALLGVLSVGLGYVTGRRVELTTEGRREDRRAQCQRPALARDPRGPPPPPSSPVLPPVHQQPCGSHHVSLSVCLHPRGECGESGHQASRTAQHAAGAEHTATEQVGELLSFKGSLLPKQALS